MKNHEFPGGPDWGEEAFDKAGVPQEYRGFARQIEHLPIAERNDRIQQMSAADQDFANYASNLDSYFNAYDAEHSHSENAPTGEAHPEKPQEKPEEWEENLAIEMLASLGEENVTERDILDFLNKFHEEQKNSGRSAESLIWDRLSDPDMIRDFAEKWEAKYSSSAKQIIPAENAAEKAGGGAREERKHFLELLNEFTDLVLRTPDDPSIRNAVDIVEEIQNMSVGEAVRHVTEAQKRDHRISKYHAAMILHALVPDKVARPEVPDLASREQEGAEKKEVPGEMSVEQMAEEEEGEPVSGNPERGRVTPEERVALDQRLKEEIESRRNTYRDFFGDKEAREEILDSGSAGMDNFLRRLDALTEVLSSESEELKKRDLIITTRKQTSVNHNSIYVSVEDLVSGDLIAVQQLADKLKSELVGEKVQEAEPTAEPEAEKENPIETAHETGGGNGEVPPKETVGAELERERREEPYGDGWPGNLYDLREGGGPGGRREDARTFAERAKERVAETASRLAERFGIKNFADWTRIGYSDELADWHTGRAVKLKASLDDKRYKIGELENGRRHLEEELRNLKDRGEVSPKALMGIQKELAEKERDIENAKNKADRVQSALEYRNGQRERYENRRNEVCRSFMNRVSERLSPFEENLSELKSTKEQLNGEIDHHRKMLNDRQIKVAALKEQVAKEKFPSLRRAYRETIKKIEREAKDIYKEVATREKDRGKIDKRIIKQDKKANPFRDRLDQLARITKRKGPDTSVGARRREEASFETRDIQGHPRMEGEEDDEGDGGSGGMPRGGDHPPRPQRPEFEKKYSGEELVGAWNKVNGSRMMINATAAKKIFPTFFEKQQSVASLDRFAEFYAERHGDEERFEGMPSMQKAARKRKRRGFWAQLFGPKNRVKVRRSLLDVLGSQK